MLIGWLYCYLLKIFEIVSNFGLFDVVTEILVDLRESIMQVARHFLSTDPKLHKDVSLVPDYSIESHSRDHEQYLDVSRTRKRRAKALLGERQCPTVYFLTTTIFEPIPHQN